jgi:outer membrane biosynthesis protein TonB
MDLGKITSSPVSKWPKGNDCGTVKVLVTIAPDGHIKDAKVVGGSPLFVNASLDALNNWRYDASNTETTTVLGFNFHP